jgi:hypothetical protein
VPILGPELLLRQPGGILIFQGAAVKISQPKERVRAIMASSVVRNEKAEQSCGTLVVGQNTEFLPHFLVKYSLLINCIVTAAVVRILQIYGPICCGAVQVLGTVSSRGAPNLIPQISGPFKCALRPHRIPLRCDNGYACHQKDKKPHHAGDTDFASNMRSALDEGHGRNINRRFEDCQAHPVRTY